MDGKGRKKESAAELQKDWEGERRISTRKRRCLIFYFLINFV